MKKPIRFAVLTRSAIAVVLLSTLLGVSSRADVKDVWIGVNGAT